MTCSHVSPRLVGIPISGLSSMRASGSMMAVIRAHIQAGEIKARLQNAVGVRGVDQERKAKKGKSKTSSIGAGPVPRLVKARIKR